MPPWMKRLPWEFFVEGDLAEGVGAGAGGQQQQVAKTPAPDPNTASKDLYNQGFNAALKFVTEYVKPGSISAEQLQAEMQKLATEKKKPTYTQGDGEVLERLKKLETENEQLRSQYAQSQIRGSFMGELIAAGVIDAEDTLTAIESKYEIRDAGGKQLIFRKGATIPETANGKEATVKDFILKYRGEKPHNFRQGGAGLETDLSNSAGGDFNVTDEQMRDTNFVKALKGTGQYDRIFEKKPVDMKRIRTFMETMR